MRALMVIDLQVDYFEHPVLQECRARLVTHCNRLAAAAHERGEPVVEVRTQHEHDRSTWTLSMIEDGQGVVLRDTPGAAALPDLRLDPTIVVLKTRDSAFHRTDLADQLHGIGVDTLALCGVHTESCVAASAADAFAHDLRVLLVEDATASGEPELHGPTLDRLGQQYRQRRVSTAELLGGA